MTTSPTRPTARTVTRAFLLSLLLTCGLPLGLAAADGAMSYDSAQKRAQGQTVYFNAWGGDPQVNSYLDWVAGEVEARFGIELRHVKLSDTAEAVSRVLSEKSAGRDDGGSIDLIWINGENFATMKENDLLYGPFVDRLPNWKLVDVDDKPTTRIDFTIPTEGYEAPWGMAKFNIIYDSARIDPAETPESMRDLAAWAEAHPSRLSYPAPPDFLGTTFLKQALIELSDNPDLLQEPVQSDEQFARVTEPLWTFLDNLHPHLWRRGRDFPKSGPAQVRMLNDGVLDMALSFYPSQASGLIAEGRLPESARTFVFDSGMIGNTHFVAIPYNAAHKAGALVVANFLMSPEAQAEKARPDVWGDQTVLDVGELPDDKRALFRDIDRGKATLGPSELGPTLLEPHPTWMTRIEQAWQRRYGS
ncbi:ABC transporter substrate-binding protein [Rhodovibrio salinarum]|uniref:ABC transporter substrate-binding protein n=1 Tax=Rhodovibrio salinarum TaxID=1087 RepID=A0A934QGW7_9PROT|nr:ABC transporter substrate-binding protein [Rhodovibrio salinarum]MBK1696300.1 ABC transporter substrate-binding protein [Rhodovibrio salinarum]